jgi:hypothetical protein
MNGRSLMKPCIECKITKPLAEFYRHPQMGDGYLNICKACHCERMRVRRLLNPQVQEQDRQRVKTPDRRRKMRAVSDRWKKKHPTGYRAHYTVTNAVRDGRLKKGPCALCGATEHVHGHHKNYAEPLNVIWLCAKCHHRLHAVFPELGANTNPVCS